MTMTLIVVALLARPHHPWYARTALLSCHFVNSIKDGPCPRQIKRKKNKTKKGRNEPQPLIASSSSRRYLPPKVKSMLQLGVETGEKRIKRGRMKGNKTQGGL